MKIISTADVHGDFETFDKALNIVRDTEADVLTISGDLNGNHFNEPEKQAFYNAYQTMLNISQGINRQNQLSNGSAMNCNKAAQMIDSGKINVNNDQGNEELKKQAETYLALEEVAKNRISENYLNFRQRFESLEQKVFIVPGNWDTRFMPDFLARYDLHLKYPKESECFRFIGYGEAQELTPMIPQKFIIGYNSLEGFDHLSKFEDAEIILTHTPPIKFEGHNSEHTGDPFLLAYMYRRQPDLILSGHSHRPVFIKDSDSGTYVINPGLLGRYGNEPYGTLAEIDIDKSGVHPVKLYNVATGKNIDLKGKVPQ